MSHVIERKNGFCPSSEIKIVGHGRSYYLFLMLTVRMTQRAKGIQSKGSNTVFYRNKKYSGKNGAADW